MDNTTNIELTPEQIDNIKAAAKRRAEEARANAEDVEDVEEIGESATKEEAAGAEQLPEQRKVALNKYVCIDIYKDDKVSETLKPDRNILECIVVLKTIDPETIVSIYATEDEALSDPVPEGQTRPLYPMFGIDKKPAKEAIDILASQGVPPQACIIEFQKLCEFMSFRSPLVAVNTVFMFKAGRAGGFSYFSSCTDVSDDDAVALYTASMEQAKQYKAKLKEMRPQVKFNDDTNIITHL